MYLSIVYPQDFVQFRLSGVGGKAGGPASNSAAGASDLMAETSWFQLVSSMFWDFLGFSCASTLWLCQNSY